MKHILKRYSSRYGLPVASSPPLQFLQPSLPAGGPRSPQFSVEVTREGQWAGGLWETTPNHGLGLFKIEDPSGEKLQKKIHLAILRDPYVQFANMWLIEDLEKFYKRPLDKFIQMDKFKLESHRKNLTFGLSQMAFDLGLDGTLSEYEFTFHAKSLVDRVDLVLIVERLEESLVLLKEQLGCSLEDVAMTYLNHTQLYFREGPIPANLIEAGIIKLAEMNSADVKLYKMFNKIMDKKIRRFGQEKMKEEIENLRRVSEEYERSCDRGVHSPVCSIARPPEFDVIIEPGNTHKFT